MRKTKTTICKMVLFALVGGAALLSVTVSGFACAAAMPAEQALQNLDAPIAGKETAVDTIPAHLVHAVVAVEDRRFFEHRGLDYLRIFRALVTNLRQGRIVEGGSTISQQYVKNAYLYPDRTLNRKIKEAFLTIELERNYDKHEILYLYLDTIYFGSGVFGIKDAAMTYFGREPQEIDLPQAALLAGIIRSPENYSPFRNPELALQRRNTVLALMYELDYISKDAYIEALSAPLELNIHNNAGLYWPLDFPLPCLLFPGLASMQDSFNLSHPAIGISAYTDGVYAHHF